MPEASRMVPFLALVAAHVLANVAFAQAKAVGLDGCFTFEAGAYDGDYSHVPDADRMLQDVHLVQPADTGRLILITQPRFSDQSYWEVISPDSVQVAIGHGFSGILMRLRLANGTLRGVGMVWSDGMRPHGTSINHVAITGHPIDCPD